MEQAWIATFCWHIVNIIFKPFPDAGHFLFLYSLRYIRKQEVSCFQGTEKEPSAMKWVQSHLIFSYLFVTCITEDSL